MKKYILLFVITFCLFPLYAQKIPPKWIKYNEKHKEIQNEFQNKLNKEGAIIEFPANLGIGQHTIITITLKGALRYIKHLAHILII